MARTAARARAMTEDAVDVATLSSDEESDEGESDGGESDEEESDEEGSRPPP